MFQSNLINLKSLDNKTTISVMKLELVGKGSMSEVYKVRNIQDEKIYALKLIKYDANRPIEAEYRILQKIENTNLIKLESPFCIIESHHCIYGFLINYCEKGSLRDQINEKINNGTKFELELVFKWMKNIIEGLQYLHHELKIMHRDIKPENILLTINDEIKIADFDSSNDSFEDTEYSLTKMIGTPGYLSPEMDSLQPYDFKTDIWSLGCVLFELVALKKFVESDNLTGFMITITQKLEILLKTMLVIKKDRSSSCELNEKLEVLKNFSNINTYPIEIFYKNILSTIVLPSSFLTEKILNFIERRDLIQEIDQTFEQKKNIVVIHFPSDSGKSALANEYGHWFQNATDTNYVYWINNNNLEKQFRKFSNDIQIATDGLVLNEIFQEIKTKLIESNKKILFIVDNCVNYEKIENFLKNLQRNILVVITTRDSSFKDQLREENSRIFYLQPFSQEECIEFMRKSLGSKVDENDLTKLLDSSNFILKDFIRPIVLNKLLELIKSKTRFQTLNKLITDRENFESIILQINNNLV